MRSDPAASLRTIQVVVDDPDWVLRNVIRLKSLGLAALRAKEVRDLAGGLRKGEGICFRSIRAFSR